MIERLRMLPLFMLLTLCCMLPGNLSLAATVTAADSATTPGKSMHSSEAVMQQFVGDEEVAPERRIDDKRKHQILFIMGLSLLVLLFMTGTLGIAMVVFEKDVFVPHMIFAGLSLTLAAAHAATAIAWFWPY